MAIWVIDNDKLQSALGTQGEAMRAEDPQFYSVVISLAQYLREEFEKKQGCKPANEELKMDLAAYCQDENSTWEEVRDLRHANGHSRPGRCEVRDDLPLPHLSDLLAHLDRCRGNLLDKDQPEKFYHPMGVLLLCERGLPRSQQDLEMREELMDIFDTRWDSDPCGRAQDVAERHCAIIYDDEKQSISGYLGSDGKISWMPHGNGSAQEAETYVHTLIEAMHSEDVFEEQKRRKKSCEEELHWFRDDPVGTRILTARYEWAREGWHLIGLM